LFFKDGDSVDGTAAAGTAAVLRPGTAAGAVRVAGADTKIRLEAEGRA